MTYNVINPILCFVFENVILLIRMRQRCPYHMMFVSFENKTTGVTCGAGTANPSGASEFNPGFCGVRVDRFLAFCVMCCRSLLVLFLS